MRQLALDAVQKWVEILELKAMRASEAIGKTLQELGALASTLAFDHGNLDGLLGWIAESSEGL